MGKLGVFEFLKNVKSPLRRFGSELFIVLDVGTFSVKGLLVEKTRFEGRVLAAASRNHVGGDISATDGSFNVSGITATCRQVLRELKAVCSSKGVSFPGKFFLGIGGGFIFGKTLHQNYIRERPHEEIDEREFANIIQKVQQRSYEIVRKSFRKETGRSELDMYIVSAAVQEVKIDGYQVVNPIGFKGKEITVRLFNSYTPNDYFATFERLANDLKLELLSIVSEPYAVFTSLYHEDPSLGDVILLDIGGSVTEISLARKGNLEEVRAVPVGGSSLTKSVAEQLKIGFWEAENIKQRFAEDKVSAPVRKKLEEIIRNDIDLLFRGIEVVLSDFSHVTLLPARIFLYGGGSSIPLVIRTLKQNQWRANLSFFSKPVIEMLSPPFHRGEKLVSLERIQHPYWAVPFAIASTSFAQEKKEEEVGKILKRSLRLIQSL